MNRLNEVGEDNMLQDNGMDPQIWYKRVKGSNAGSSKKVDDAIMRQLTKLNDFKRMTNEKP